MNEIMRTRPQKGNSDPTVRGWLQDLKLSEVKQFTGEVDEFVMARSGSHSLSERLVRLVSGEKLHKDLAGVPTVVIAQDYPQQSSHPGDALVAAVRWLLFGMSSESAQGVSPTHPNRLALLLSTAEKKLLPKKTLTPFETLARALNSGPTPLQVELWVQIGKGAKPHSHTISANAFKFGKPPAGGPYSERVEGWAKDLKDRPTRLAPLAADLEERVKDPSFRWYLPSTGKRWSGRVEGLEVCKLSSNERGFILTVGKTPKPATSPKNPRPAPTAREIFLELLRKSLAARSLPFKKREKLDEKDGIDLAAEVIREVVTERSSGKLAGEDREHRLEAQILRRAVKLQVGSQELLPVELKHPFQFPTLWHDGERSHARYLDALMRIGSTPWAVEVKVNTSSGPGSYYSHGITQAVLYREFIREAAGAKGTPFFEWFAKRKGLKPADCQGMLVIEPMRTRQGGPHPEQQRRTDELRETARCFGIELREAVAVP